jgi:hypothetical protein
MNEDFLRRLESGSGIPDLAAILAERLSGADLNSLLLEVFRRKTDRLSAPELLRQYRQNRFVQPAAVDAVGFAEFCLHWLKAARDAGFQPLQLSPVSPLGSCSVFGAVHQNKVMSALRGAELVADATNVLALESAVQRRDQGFPPEALHFSVVHRHVRAQEVPKVPGFSAHFSILGLTSAGRDTGSFAFEKENLLRHIAFYKTFFEEKLDLAPVKIRLKSLDADGMENRLVRSVASFLQETEPAWPVEIIESQQSEQAYYRGLQFKIVIPNPGGTTTQHPEFEIADGGFTDWTQRLSQNAKERLLISGMGLELLYKMLHP